MFRKSIIDQRCTLCLNLLFWKSCALLMWIQKNILLSIKILELILSNMKPLITDDCLFTSEVLSCIYNTALLSDHFKWSEQQHQSLCSLQLEFRCILLISLLFSSWILTTFYRLWCWDPVSKEFASSESDNILIAEFQNKEFYSSFNIHSIVLTVADDWSSEDTNLAVSFLLLTNVKRDMIVKQY